jgi:hypothetical protein
MSCKGGFKVLYLGYVPTPIIRYKPHGVDMFPSERRYTWASMEEAQRRVVMDVGKAF